MCQGKPTSQKMKILGLKDVPFPSSEELIGLGSGKFLAHNSYDPRLFIRVSISLPNPKTSLYTPAIINITPIMLVYSGSTHKSPSSQFTPKERLLNHSKSTCFEIAGVVIYTQNSNPINLLVDEENQSSYFLIT